MKKIAYLTALLSVFTACSSEEPFAPNDDPGAISIKVSDCGFSSSRAADENLTTVFTDGDRIGLFAVIGGVIMPEVNNVCVQATEVDGVVSWTPQSDLPDMEGATYYAYYPYQESLDGSPEAAATDADAFFAEIIEKWQVAVDQSDYDAYTQSDLMVAKGEIADGALSLGMKHEMSLVRIFFPSVSYVFTNASAMSPYSVKNSTDVTIDGWTALPMAGNEYRLLVNPADEGVGFQGTYLWEGKTRQWIFEVTPACGKANTVNVDRDKSQTVEHNLQVGDYFLADGTLLSKDTDAADVMMSDVVGIVYNISPDRIGKAEKEALGGAAHGSVMAVKDVSTPYTVGAWSIQQLDETEIGIENVLGSTAMETAQMADGHISGYAVLKAIKEKRADLLASGNYEMMQDLDKFNSEVKGTDNLLSCTTGWYMPAAGQWFDIVRNLGNVTLEYSAVKGGRDLLYWSGISSILSNVNASMAAVSMSQRTELGTSRWYWAATLSSQRDAYMLQLTDGIGALNSLSFFGSGKGSYAYCRPVLTF